MRTWLRWQKKTLARMALIISLVGYMPGGWFFPAAGAASEKADVREIPEDAESGLGGEILPEKLPPGVDLELSGVPEPEELSRARILTFSSYTMEKGDIIGNIAAGAGLNEDTLISANNIKNTRLMQIGQAIRIPNQDGIFYAVKEGDTLEGIAEKYGTSSGRISAVNELFSDKLALNAGLFIPGAKMDWVNRQEINGDLFIWPCSGYISSAYGYRASPFTGVRQFHSGLDIGARSGTAIKAAMAGRVAQVGFNETFGNYAIISHHSGYRTLYAHMSFVRVKAGAYVETGGRVGDVGSTGLSTGPHLHFTVYKDGVTVNPRSLMK